MPSVFKLVQITDTHLLADPAGRQAGWNTQASLEAVLADIRLRHQPQALLATGDLVHDETPEGYRRLAQLLAGFSVPVLALPGNHDDPATLAEYMTGVCMPFHDSAPHGGWQMLALDDHQQGKDGGHLAAEQLQRLESRLASNPAPALVALHHPPIAVGSDWLDAIGLDNGEELLNLLLRFPQVRILVCGHIHQELDVQFKGLRILAAPSTCRQFRPCSKDFAEDPAQAPGYRVISLDSNSGFSTRVYRVPAAAAAARKMPDEKT